ncbi:hypothetical protein [Halomarina litorea]|nr:hypothetical protein [Halomarina sp. BCD28]
MTLLVTGMDLMVVSLLALLSFGLPGLLLLAWLKLRGESPED